MVCLPGGHFVWAVQESVSVLLVDVSDLKNPVAHSLHRGCAEDAPLASVYLPGGHRAVMEGFIEVLTLE